MDSENRHIPIQFYVNEDEKTVLDLKYKHSGKRSLSSFRRELVVEGKVYDIDYLPAFLENPLIR